MTTDRGTQSRGLEPTHYKFKRGDTIVVNVGKAPAVPTPREHYGFPQQGDPALDRVDPTGRRVAKEETFQERLERLAGACLDFERLSPERILNAVPQHQRAAAMFDWPRRPLTDEDMAILQRRREIGERIALQHMTKGLDVLRQAGPIGLTVATATSITSLVRTGALDDAQNMRAIGLSSAADAAMTSAARLPSGPAARSRPTPTEPIVFGDRAAAAPRRMQMERPAPLRPSRELLEARGVLPPSKPLRATQEISPEAQALREAAARLVTKEGLRSSGTAQYARAKDAMKRWRETRPRIDPEIDAEVERSLVEPHGPVPKYEPPPTRFQRYHVTPKQESVLGNVLGRDMRVLPKGTKDAKTGEQLVSRVAQVWGNAVKAVHGNAQGAALAMQVATQGMSPVEAGPYVRKMMFAPVRREFNRRLYAAKNLRDALEEHAGIHMSDGDHNPYVEVMGRDGSVVRRPLNIDHGHYDLKDAVRQSRETGDWTWLETVIDGRNLRLVMPLENQGVLTQIPDPAPLPQRPEL